MVVVVVVLLVTLGWATAVPGTGSHKLKLKLELELEIETVDKLPTQQVQFKLSRCPAQGSGQLAGLARVSALYKLCVCVGVCVGVCV